MPSIHTTRRRFLKTAAASSAVPYFFTGANLLSDEAKADSPNDRPIIGCIGTGSRWNAVGPNAMVFGDCVAVCDVDADHAQKAKKRVEQIQDKKGRSDSPDVYEDYHELLKRDDIDIVTIVTPDHWHTKIAIEAMQAGKDVYCEKPLTLTIEEGKQILKALKETGRVFQVGTQQRSEMGLRFLQAVAMIRDGRVGELKSVQCAIGGAPTSGPIAAVDSPSSLNWEKWLGQAPLADYRWERKGSGRPNTRCHYEFRWWYEYSGGKMTDWGAHHVDIAHWALGMDDTGPTHIEGTAKHPVPFEDGYPTDPTQYNAATSFMVKCKCPGDVELIIRNDTDNGIMFTGTKGRFFVNRGKIVGKPVEELEENPLPEDALIKAYKGKSPGGGNAHMRNFFECVKTREQPISDVPSHHRAMTTCHLANIAIRLGRPIRWDPKAEQIIGDEQAQSFQQREQRKGYEIVV